MRKNPDTIGTLLVGALAIGGGYLAYRMLTDGKKPARLDAASAWATYDRIAKASGPGTYLTKSQHDQLWNLLDDAEKDYATSVYSTARSWSDVTKIMDNPETAKNRVAVGFFTKGMTIAFGTPGAEANAPPAPPPAAAPPAATSTVPSASAAYAVAVRASSTPPKLTEQQFAASLWATLSDAEKRLFMQIPASSDPKGMDKMMALMAQPAFQALMEKMARAEAAALPKGTSGFGDYHHGVY